MIEYVCCNDRNGLIFDTTPCYRRRVLLIIILRTLWFYFVIIDWSSDISFSSFLTRCSNHQRYYSTWWSMPCLFFLLLLCENQLDRYTTWSLYFSVNTTFQSLCFLSGFPWLRSVANKEAIEQRFPRNEVEVVTSKY